MESIEPALRSIGVVEVDDIPYCSTADLQSVGLTQSQIETLRGKNEMSKEGLQTETSTAPGGVATRPQHELVYEVVPGQSDEVERQAQFMVEHGLTDDQMYSLVNSASQETHHMTESQAAGNQFFVNTVLGMEWIDTPDDGNCGVWPWLAAISAQTGKHYFGGDAQLRRDVAALGDVFGMDHVIVVDGGETTTGQFFFPFNGRDYHQYLRDMGESWIEGSTANYVDGLFHMLAGTARRA